MFPLSCTEHALTTGSAALLLIICRNHNTQFFQLVYKKRGEYTQKEDRNKNAPRTRKVTADLVSETYANYQFVFLGSLFFCDIIFFFFSENLLCRMG
jgi:hypothetical protein